ncbi:MAG: restriction endonuclease subunit S [Akkermansia sp.]|nr:restriction endonuclease subunit S [Akkermansia sp.]
MSDKIERIIDALRKKILESAIRGELVPQNPEDEPASKLLERIAEERERLIKEKKIKKPKSTFRIFRRDGHFYESINGGTPTCIDDDIPFEIPNSWEWCRLESICEVNPRNKLNEELLAGFIPMASVREGFSNYHDVNTKKWGEIKSGYTHLRNNDVMVAKITPCFQNRKSAIVDNLPNGYGAGSTEFHIARTFDEKIIPSFLLVLFKSEYFIQKGLATFTGTAGQQRISSDFFSSFLIALPPTNEQFRLVRAVQNRLQALNDIEKSRKRYKYILSETPTSLRQQLIQAAIQGLLVSQNPNDEPASVLLERIAEERTSKLGKKAAKSMSRIERRGSKTYELYPDGTEKDISEDIPFDIPLSWAWCRLSYISNGLQYGTSQKSNSTGKYAVLRMGNIQNGEIDFSDLVYSNNKEDFSKLELKKGDVLFNRTNSPEWVGKTAIFRNHKMPCIFAGYLIRINQMEQIDGDYLNYFLNSSSARKQGDAVVSLAVNQANISGGKLSDYFIPIPPMQEQHRIVEKLGALLKLV